MRLSNNAEEILERLWIMTMETGKKTAGFKELKTAKNAPEVEELIALNYIDVSEKGIALNKEGMKEAEDAVRRHRLAERLMIDVFGIRKNLMEDTACQFEHLIRKAVEENICTLLGHPKVCPHGKPIPRGRCCRKGSRSPKSIVSSLADAKKGTKGKVAYLHTGDNKKLRKLMTMGILPGVLVEVVQTFPSHVFQIGHMQVAVDREMAGDIFIRLARRPGR
ncbi:MAG TPA: DtxR family iron (metal) dependent repressor [Nitrospirae bacterium]|nr:DtxR family iron (metal) dependent repressor [Nitrospirota bacterium]